MSIRVQVEAAEEQREASKIPACAPDESSVITISKEAMGSQLNAECIAAVRVCPAMMTVDPGYRQHLQTKSEMR